MAPKRDPRRDKAFEIYKEHGGNIQNRQLANMLDLPERTVGGWKSKDKWDEKLNGVLQSNERSTPIEKGGTSPPGKGKKGSADTRKGRNSKQPPSLGGAPEGNQNAVTHGLYRKHLPPSISQLMDEIRGMPPLDMIYESIIIDFAKIIEALRLMHVRSENDHLRVVKKKRWDVGGKVDTEGDDGAEAGVISEIEYEVQVAPERQASAMKALATVQTALRANIKMFMELSGKDDKRRLEIERMQVDIEKTRAEVEKLKDGGNDGQPTEIHVRRWMR